MNKKQIGYQYYQYRKSIYASMNARKGNLLKLQKSKLLSIEEKKDLSVIIDLIDEFAKKIKPINHISTPGEL